MLIQSFKNRLNLNHQINIQSLFTYFIIISLLLLFSNRTFANETSKETTNPAHLTLMLDWFVNPIHGPIIIAKQQGLFKKEGLIVDIQEPADPSLPPKLVAANKVDLAITYEPNFILNIAQGLPLKYVSALIPTPLNTIITRQNSDIKTIKNLKGKTIGTSITGIEEASIKTMLNDSGLTLSDVKIINVGWNLSTSLASKKVDAIFGGMRTFETNQLELLGVKINVFNVEDYGIPTYQELIFVTNLNNNKTSEIKKFNHAIAQATKFILAHPNESWDSFKSYKNNELDTPLNKKAWFDTINYFSKHTDINNIKNYQKFADFLYQNKLLDQQIDVRPFF